MEILKADRMPIGKFRTHEKNFTQKEKQLIQDDVFYMFSDGYRDQFGGADNSKLGSRNFKKLLTDIHALPIAIQHQHLDDFFNKWKGDREQIDDILILGFKV